MDEITFSDFLKILYEHWSAKSSNPRPIGNEFSRERREISAPIDKPAEEEEEERKAKKVKERRSR